MQQGFDPVAVEPVAEPGLSRLQAALAQATTADEACRALEAAVAPLGYNSVDYASGPIRQWPMRDNLDWRPDVVFASYDWAEVYFGTDFQKHDRMLPHMLRQLGPWLYWDVWQTSAQDPVTQELERRAQEKVKSGISIPFHGPGLRFAAVNLGSGLSPYELEQRDRHTRADAFLMASLTHGRIQALTGAAPAPAALTARETECLAWAARGKTVWEIARILSLSDWTVKKYIGSAYAKLDARNGSHAVAIALSRGLISL